MSDAQTSSRRAAANLRNSKRSTGPKSTERTRFNALKHGLRAKSPILPGEDAEALRARHQAFTASIEPVDEVERLLVDRLVKISWRLDRVDLSDADLSGADLRDVVLTASKLRGTDLRHARLSGADLRGADLGEITPETPAVLRLYDAAESQRGQGGDGVQCILLVLDEGDTVEIVNFVGGG